MIVNRMPHLVITFSKKTNSKQTYGLRGRRCSQRVNQIVYENLFPKTQKLVKIINGNCSICDRNESQSFTMLSDSRRRFF